ncbi:hypothetical protein FACS189452_08540 [Bacteroidia bacterium]|nr:hypothetical protein FACS189452_08540 [Bacteroidia bacterium]GHT80211.1 hypothetical protein FACS189467_1810 [Bacteroidia bacterium]
MKKILLYALAAGVLFSACEKDEIGGTATQAIAGEWVVTVDVIQNDILYEDGYGIGHFAMYTYNTAANLPTEMWLEDGAHFWDYKTKVAVADFTFSTSDFVDNQVSGYEDMKLKITEGKILLGAATTPSGYPADSIYYKVQFDDDGENGDLIHIVHGYRHTGLANDD